MKLDYTELENGIRLIKLTGALDMIGTHSIEVQFVRHCEGENARVLVDLSKVNYMSSIGIPMLVDTFKSVESRGGKMALLNPQDNILKLLELVGVDEMIPIYPDLDSAVAELSA